MHMDFVGMETMIAMRKWPVVKTVLVLIDHFTWFVCTYIVEDRQATMVAKVLYDEYFFVLGFPHWLMLDNAPEFVVKVLMALCDLLNVKNRWERHHTTPSPMVPWSMPIRFWSEWLGSLTLKRKEAGGQITSCWSVTPTTRPEVRWQATSYIF